MIDWRLPGLKSYAVGFLIIVVSGLFSLDYITEQTYKALMGLLGGAGLIALRAGIAKLGGK